MTPGPKVRKRDIFLSTTLTFLILWAVKHVVVNSEYLNPLMQVLDDFQFTDLYFSKYKKPNAQVDTNIVIVNIGENDRLGIAHEIETIKRFHPKIIGLDVLFKSKKNAEDDSVLKAAIHDGGKVVSVSMISYEEGNESGGEPILESNDSYFDQKQHEGFGSFLSEEEQTVRYYTPFLKLNNSEYPAFTTKIVEEIDIEAYKKLVSRHKKSEIINYQTNNFIKLDVSDMNGGTDLNCLENKIVLLGYMGPDFEHKVFEDIHLTPLNKRYGGHTEPDKYGIEIHANIIAMILHRDYITEVPKRLINIIAFLVCMFHMYFFIYMFVAHHKWFHTGALVLQIISFAVLVIFSIMVFHLFRLKLEPTVILMGVLLSVESLYFYDDLAKFMNEKFGFKTSFNRHH